ncbi:MAG: hypothetical protein A2846_03345 [Candidatus Doudnabacteria bacterium RIFCSPHIGHO2_01_FULL_49_9]|uniref:Lipid-A-disaccharide synthase n=1 Tax=Candidatus Doudnabacteria bacterium RIFCSPHIGHO2_01_FULL_49_9 TaxID=1817827 RepID=A0A1F5NYE3_9BACT|nr:MAG: hypothetical protein A2846_03345 [Candidatus Doudnabacteria bacterium RIFCSPHIGHO2_01_FULL_49_9]
MSLLKKIKLKSETVLGAMLIKVSLLLQWPALTALVFAAMTRDINHAGEYTVLCMRRSIFMDDVRAMARFSGRIRYLVVGRELVMQILTHFVGKTEMKKITRDYYSGNYGAVGKEKTYQYLKKVWPIYKKMKKFDAVLYSNFCYIEEQELARACGDLGIPLIVLFKEGMVSPGTHVAWARKAHKGFRFRGQAKMLVYNEEIKKAMAEINVPGLTADKLQVVGIPRMDHYFRNAAVARPAKQVTFFSTDLVPKLSLLVENETERRELAARFEYFHRMVMEFATAHPVYQVIIKTKSYQLFLDYVLDIKKRYFPQRINNLAIVNSGDPAEMIKTSQVVIGFGSTTLVEALAANKTIISFDFSKLLADSSFDYFRNYPGLVNYAGSPGELEEIISNYEKYQPRDPEQRRKFLESFLYLTDGRSSNRAEESIITIIKTYEHTAS